MLSITSRLYPNAEGGGIYYYKVRDDGAGVIRVLAFTVGSLRTPPSRKDMVC